MSAEKGAKLFKVPSAVPRCLWKYKSVYVNYESALVSPQLMLGATCAAVAVLQTRCAQCHVVEKVSAVRVLLD
jgi:hypothetical protein